MEFKKRFKYNLKESDARGDLQGFPLEIIEKMIDNQVLQGNPPNVFVFIENRISNELNGGFNWKSSPEGSEFWSTVLYSRYYSYFYIKYPRK